MYIGYRMYITPVRLHHMSANIPDVCSKCLTEKGTLFHCQWECLDPGFLEGCFKMFVRFV